MTQYYSNSKEEYVNINDMHHQHVWYAFKKLCDRLEQLHIAKDIWENDYYKHIYKPTNSKVQGYVRKDVYEMLFDKCEQLEKNANSRMVFKLEKEVSRLKQQIRNMYAEQSHSAPRYYFSEIPNDGFGRDFVDNLKTFLNKDRYKLRVRGQYLDKSKLRKNETWRNYDDGQPLSKSKCIRVYIDQKREK